MSSVNPSQRDVGLPPGTKVKDLITARGIMKIQAFQRAERARLAFEESPEGVALATRRRISSRGGAQSTILTGVAPNLGSSVFKKNLGGTR